MTPPLLATKLFIPPPRADLVARPRLIERLNQGLAAGYRLTLVSAPAGFGKTTLLSDWVARCGRRSAWLSLDEGDSDITRFLSYWVAALQTLSAGIGAGALAALQAAQPCSVESFLTTLLNEVAAIAHDFILVLDDYHLIDAKPVGAATSVDDVVTFLLEHQPPQMHLVVATREDPALPLPRFRVRGQLTELRAADLRFTPAEAAEFLNRVMALGLSDGDVAALEARTEGWIAGLQMAALSMQSRQDSARLIQTFTGSHRFVLDYLLQEVLHQQPETVQAFLLRTSILRRLCGPLCDALVADADSASQVAGGKTGQEILEHLERANLFIVPLDNERRWYRYHHLFGDLLRQQLERSRPGDEIAEYHHRASQWHAQNGAWAEAFHHALAAGAHVRAALVAEAAWEDMERTFQTLAWRGWVERLPPAVVRARPRLCVQLGWAFSDSGELESSEAWLQNAEAVSPDAPTQREYVSLPANIALIRASNAQNQGKLAETVRYTELALQLASEDDVSLRAQAAITLGFTHWATGNVEVSLQAMHTWMANMQKAGNQLFVIASAFVVADMLEILGCLSEAERTLQQTIQLATEHQEGTAVTAHHHLGLALLSHERGDAAATTQHLETAADLGQRTTLVDWPYRWNLAQARLRESAGDWDAALAFLDEARRVYVKNPVPILQPVVAHQARVFLRQGRWDRAQAWLRERGVSTEDEVRYLDEYDHLTLARMRLAQGAFNGVDDLLQRLLTLAETQNRVGSLIEILLTQALVHHAQNHQPQAAAALQRALVLAEPERYLRIFVDEGEPLRLLILNSRSVIERQVRDDRRLLLNYVNKLLASFPHTIEKSSQPEMALPDVAIVEALSERELQVLRLIAQGLSNSEVSERLILALSTIKGHNLRIFAKLQVQNRTEAVIRARELGLL